MANIFESLKEAPDDVIALQVALFQCVTAENVLRSMGNKGQTIIREKVFNLLRRENKQNSNDFNEFIESTYNDLRAEDRKKLDIKLLNCIAQRLDLHLAIPIQNLSDKVIEEASKSIEQDISSLTPAQKADFIAVEFQNRIRKQINRLLKEKSDTELAQLEKQLDIDIAQMTPENRERMKDALHVETLTGKTVRDTLVQTGVPILLLGSASGLGTFVATTTIIHAVFTTLLGITLPFGVYTVLNSTLALIMGPVGLALLAGLTISKTSSMKKKIDRELFMELVYLAFVFNGEQFAPYYTEMSTWKSPDQIRAEVENTLTAKINELQSYNNSLVTQDELKRQIENIEAVAAKKINEQAAELKKLYDDKIEEIKKDNKSKEEKYESIIRIQDEENKQLKKQEEIAKKQARDLIKKYKAEVEQQNREITELRATQDMLIRKNEIDNKNKIIRNEQIRKKLIEAITTAKKEIDIWSPWINYHVVNRDLQKDFMNALNRGVAIRIRYGIGNVNSQDESDSRSKNTEKVAIYLREKFKGKDFKMRRVNDHSKLFICDDTFYVLTSYNPLSFDGDYTEKGIRGEIGEVSKNVNNIHAYRERFFSF